MRRIRYYEEEKKDKDPKVQKMIKDFIEIDWSKDQDSAGKAVNLLKGLAFSDDPMAEKFIKDLDKLSNTMNVEDYAPK